MIYNATANTSTYHAYEEPFTSYGLAIAIESLQIKGGFIYF